MNKTLLLIIIDFLFLNLIALTRWEKAEPSRPVQPPVPQLAANAAAATRDQDLVDTMRQSLADEQANREQLEQKLAQTDSTLSQREQGLSELQTEKARLAASLTDTQRTAQELSQAAQAAREESSLTREQLAQLQRELDEKRALADRQQQAIAKLEADQTNARKQIEGLTMAVVVGEADKQHLQEEAKELQGQVEVERADRLKVQESTQQLAAGVGELAENSGALTKEIRDNRPINANVLFNDFLADRIQTTFTATRRGLFGEVNRAKDTPTVFISDGKAVFALLHIDDTVFSTWENNYDWQKIGVVFHRGDAQTAGGRLEFLNADPRVVVVPVSAEQVAALGAKVYPLAADPLKFPDAVLISGSKGYGELSFRLDPANPGYVRVDNRFFKRIFGDFAPARGDLVFSHTGELLGIMVNNDYCALLRDFSPSVSIQTGSDTLAQHTSLVLDQLEARVRALPPDLQ
jgi:hypothetical protein